MQVIIFDNGQGGVGIITPTAEWLEQGKTVEQCAAKDVPQGAAYEIVDDSILPWDQPRETWEWV